MTLAPYGLPSGAAAWTVADYRREVLTSSPAADGRASVTFDQLDVSELWLVDRAVVSATAAAAAVRFYESQESPAGLLSGSNSGTFDEAEYPGGMLVQPGTQLVAVWTGVADGTRCTASVQIRVLRPAG